MSLVNQMLQDLDRRQAPDAPNYVMRHNHSTEKAQSPLMAITRRLPWIFCTLLATVPLYMMWQESNRTAENIYSLETPQIAHVTAGKFASERPDSLPAQAAQVAGQPARMAPEYSLAEIEPPTEELSLAGLSPGDPPPEPYAQSNYVFAPSHDPIQDIVAKSMQIIPPVTSVEPETIESAPKTTRLSNTPVEYPDSTLTTNATPMAAFSNSIIDRNTPESIISIVPAGGAAARSYKKARLFLDEWKTEEAQTELRRTLVFDPGHNPARELLVALLLQQGDELAAESVVETGLNISSHYSPFVQLKARILSSRGDTQTAIETMTSITPDLRHRVGHDTTLAALYQKSGNHTEAVVSYLALIGNNPEEPALWSGLAISLDALGQLQAALKSYRQALKSRQLSPDLRTYAQQRMQAISSTIDSENS